MKRKSLFKSKLQLIIYTIIFIICIILFIVIGKKDYGHGVEHHSEKFSNLFNSVEDDNLYVFANSSQVLNIVNGKSGIVFMSFPSNEWSNHLAKILNDAAKINDISEIYYYDFLEDRKTSNGTYETIVSKLKEYVPTDDEGFQDLQAPTILIVKNGEVIVYLDDTSVTKGNISPDEYYTEEMKTEIFNKILYYLDIYKEGE